MIFHVLLIVDDIFYVGEFQNEKQIKYMIDMARGDLLERRDFLIIDRELDAKTPFMRDGLQINPFFEIHDDEEKDDYCIETEEIQPWFKEVQTKNEKNFIKIKITKEC